MKKILLFLVMTFMSLSIVNAEITFQNGPRWIVTDRCGAYQLTTENTQIGNTFMWGRKLTANNGVGSGNNCSVEMDFFAYPPNNDYDKMYDITGIIYTYGNYSQNPKSFILTLNGYSCEINNYTYTGIGGGYDEYQNNITSRVDGYFSYTCTNVKVHQHSGDNEFILTTTTPQSIFFWDGMNYTPTQSNVITQNEIMIQGQEEIKEYQEQQVQQQQETNKELGELNDNLTNSDAPDGMDSLGSASGWLPPGPVDSLLTLPLSMLNNISTSLGSSCRPINLPIPFVNQNLTMPCLNTIYSQISGLGVFLNSIGTIAAGFMLYYYFKKLYAYIDNLLSLKNNGEGWGDV